MRAVYGTMLSFILPSPVPRILSQLNTVFHESAEIGVYIYRGKQPGISGRMSGWVNRLVAGDASSTTPGRKGVKSDPDFLCDLCPVLSVTVNIAQLEPANGRPGAPGTAP